MSGDVQLELWLHEYKLEALASVLAEQGSSIEKRMDELLYDLYTELLSQELQNEIQQRINAEFAAREAELEAARRYTVFRVRQSGTDEFYQMDHSETFLDVAKFLRSYLRKDQASPTTAFKKFLRDLKPVSAEQYDQLMENPQKVTGVFDLDFNRQEVSVVDAADGWRSYTMKDAASAVYYTYRKSGLPGLGAGECAVLRQRHRRGILRLPEVCHLPRPAGRGPQQELHGWSDDPDAVP